MLNANETIVTWINLIHNYLMIFIMVVLFNQQIANSWLLSSSLLHDHEWNGQISYLDPPPLNVSLSFNTSASRFWFMPYIFTRLNSSSLMADKHSPGHRLCLVLHCCWCPCCALGLCYHCPETVANVQTELYNYINTMQCPNTL